MIPPANKQTLTHRVLKVELGKPVFFLPWKDSKPQGWLMGMRVEEVRERERCPVMGQIRVQDLPDYESVQTSDMVFNHVKRFEQNNHIGVDDSNSNVTDGRVGLKVPRIQPRTVKAVSNCRVLKDALLMLEPDEVKISRPVLRGLGAGNSPRLPGISPVMFKET